MLKNYERLNNGVIKQRNVVPYVYDQKYIQDRYDQYGVQCDMMSYLRYGFIVGTLKRKIVSVLDVGYGNGAFLKICQMAGTQTYGTDISNYELRYGHTLSMDECFKRQFDIVTFFDSLEHFPNFSFLENLKCRYVCISVPNCRYNGIMTTQGEKSADEYFQNWKHRREDEHIWHFDVKSLDLTMQKLGYEMINYEHIEDIIRKSVDEYPNILTAIFEKRNR